MSTNPQISPTLEYLVSLFNEQPVLALAALIASGTLLGGFRCWRVLTWRIWNTIRCNGLRALRSFGYLRRIKN